MLLALDDLPRPSSAPPLADGAVDLWSFAYDEVTDRNLLPSYESIMTPDEKERCHALLREEDRNMFRATRALVRASLSCYTTRVKPSDWRFASTPEGRPFVSAPLMERPLYFNLSNTPGLIVCAISGHQSVGVDVEMVDPKKPLEGLAESHFSERERSALRELPADKRADRFFAFWTLKESYVKAKGVGIGEKLPLDRFSLVVDEEKSPKIRFDPRIVDSSRRWRFVRLTPKTNGPERLIAVAVDTGGSALTLRGASCIPLVSQEVRASRSVWRRKLKTGENRVVDLGDSASEATSASQHFPSARRIHSLKIDD